MHAARLRHLVQIQDYTNRQDSHGDDFKDYETDPPFAEVLAGIFPLRGRELFAAQQDFSEAETRIEVRYIRGLNPRMRIAHIVANCPVCGNLGRTSDEFFDIIHAKDIDERHEWYELICKSGVSEER